MDNDSGLDRFAFHIPPESVFTSPRNPYSPFPGTPIHMARNPQQWLLVVSATESYRFLKAKYRGSLLTNPLMYGKYPPGLRATISLRPCSEMKRSSLAACR